jgi:hypothetical protein
MAAAGGEQGQLFYRSIDFPHQMIFGNRVTEAETARSVPSFAAIGAPHCSSMDRPTIDPELIRMLVVGYDGTIEGESSSNSRRRSIWLLRELGTSDCSFARMMRSLSATSVDIARL